jgi:transcriptional regulator with XRE-family HTH domain
MRVGQRIKTARKEAKLTQQQLADQVHITARSLQWYESGDRQPPPSVLFLIAQVTDKDIAWFFNNERSPA